MGIELFFILLALILVPITNGSLKKLFSTQLKSKWTLGVIFVGLLTIDYAPIPESRFDDLGFGILMASYVLLIGFIIANISLKGIWIALIGLASNAIVIALNFGMPVKASSDFSVVESIKHQNATSKDLLSPLGDIMAIKPLKIAISVGDIIFGLGLIVVCFFLSRKDKKVAPITDEEFELEEILDDNFAEREELVVSEKQDLLSQPVLFRIESEIMPKTTTENDLEFIEQAQVLEIQNQEVVEPAQENFVVVDVASEEIVELNDEEEKEIVELANQKNKDTKKELRKYKSSTLKRSSKRKKGIYTLPTKEELGYSEESMEIVQAAE